MADAYIANESEIKSIRKRRTVVSKREDDATTKDKDLTSRENFHSRTRQRRALSFHFRGASPPCRGLKNQNPSPILNTYTPMESK